MYSSTGSPARSGNDLRREAVDCTHLAAGLWDLLEVGDTKCSLTLLLRKAWDRLTVRFP